MSKKPIALIIAFLLSFSVFCQNHYSVTYKPIQPSSGTDYLRTIRCSTDIVEIVNSGNYVNSNLIPSPSIKSFIDFKTGSFLWVAVSPDGKIFSTVKSFEQLPEINILDDTEIILGYNCKHATTSIFSNRIDLYYVTELGLKGSPLSSYGLPEGLVLKVVRNRSSGWVASEIEMARPCDLPVGLPSYLGRRTDEFTYDAMLRESYVKSVTVFTNDHISWGNKIDNPDPGKSDVVYRYAGGTIILKKIRMPEIYSGSSLFAEIIQYSNGDAYDRTGTIFLIPEGKELSFLDGLVYGAKSLSPYYDADNLDYQGVVATGDYLPALELVRFFTPFGVKHYNERRLVRFSYLFSIAHHILHLKPIHKFLVRGANLF